MSEVETGLKRAAWWDLARVIAHLARVALFFTIPVCAALFFVVGLSVFQSSLVRALYSVLGLLCIWRTVVLVRLAIRIWKAAQMPNASNSELSVPIPFVELGTYFECAQVLRPRGWWLEEASLARSPSLLLEQEHWPDSPARVKIGLPLLAVLSDEEARCLMTYKVARRVHFPSAIDRFLERLHRAARTRVKSTPGKKPPESNPGAILWVPLYRYTAKSMERNEQFARSWTSAQCGKELFDRTLENIKRIEQAWPVFESGLLRPLLTMGGIPPVAESFQIWFAQSGKSVSAGTPGNAAATNEPSESARTSRLPQYERLLYMQVLEGRELKPIPRQDAYARLGPAFWEEQSRTLRDVIPDKRLRDLPLLLRELPSLVASTQTSIESELPEAKKKQKLVDQLYFASLTALSKAGWSWQVPPIQPIILSRNGIQICPQLWIQNLLNGSLSAGAFESALEEQGLLDLPFTQLQESSSFVM